jgi:hypothetical protein
MRCVGNAGVQKLAVAVAATEIPRLKLKYFHGNYAFPEYHKRFLRL